VRYLKKSFLRTVGRVGGGGGGVTFLSTGDRRWSGDRLAVDRDRWRHDVSYPLAAFALDISWATADRSCAPCSFSLYRSLSNFLNNQIAGSITPRQPRARFISDFWRWPLTHPATNTQDRVFVRFAIGFPGSEHCRITNFWNVSAPGNYVNGERQGRNHNNRAQ